MLFLKSLYIPDLAEIKRTGKAVYYPITSQNDTLNILLKLSSEDGEKLEDAMNKRSEKYRIEYAIQGAKCMHCNQILPDIRVDMETVLFRRINNNRRTQNED
jgi:predicted transcriptional regulator